MKDAARNVTSIAAVVLALGALAACGGEDPASDESAVDVACGARQDLIDSISAVTDELRSANFGAAKDALPAVGTSVDGLGAAINDLAADEKEELAPQIDAVKASWEAARSPATIADLRTSLSELSSSATDLASALSSDLSCS